MADRPFNLISLCTGGGGLDAGAHLALSRLGYAPRTVCCVERDAFACEVLAGEMEAGRMAPAAVWSDLRTFDGRPWRGIVHGVIAGIPCQGNSLAGKRLLADDERDLWSDTARILREVQPEWFLLENVYGFMVPDRKGGREAPIRRVLRELAAMGWDAEWCVLPASSVGASHRRERVFVLANRVGSRAGDQSRADRGLQRADADAPSTEALRQAHGAAGSGRTDAGGVDVAHGPSGGLGECGQPPQRDGQPDGGDEDLGDTGGAQRGIRPEREELQQHKARREMPCERVGDVDHAERAEQGPGIAGDEGRPRLGRGGPANADHDVADAQLPAATRQQQHGGRDDAGTEAVRLDGTGSQLADARRELPQGINPAGPARGPTGRGGGGVVGDTASGDECGIERSGVDAGLQAHGGRQAHHNQPDGSGIGVARARVLPIFAPGPADPRWRDIIALAPSLEPAVRDLADGLATTRREWLRVLGNGVVPLQAAAAIGALWDAMEGDRR